MRKRDQIFKSRFIEEAENLGIKRSPKPKTLDDALKKLKTLEEEISKQSKEILELKERIKS